MNHVFFEVFEKLPRVGPGNNESTGRAFNIIKSKPGFPQNPNILDIGCGTGVHTTHLATLSDGKIIAMDNHQAFLDKLQTRMITQGVADKIDIQKGDMGAMDFDKESFHLLWVEGAIFIIGFENGLSQWRQFLKPGGFIALTDLFWFKPNPPEEPKAFFDQIAPGMLNLEEALAVVERTGYRCVDHFQLPANVWWDSFYTPLEEQLPIFRETYKDDSEAMETIEFFQAEIDIYRKYSDHYGYIFFILEKSEG
jgi:ubiquinone/menaquinone biosynthesis C-methylase UbiE